MRLPLLALPLLLVSSSSICQSASFPPAPSSAATPAVRLAAGYGTLPLSFEPNRGQFDSDVKFVARNSNGSEIFLTDSAAILMLTKRNPGAHKLAGQASADQATDVVRMELHDSAQGASVTGVDKLPGTANYFIGEDPAKWHVNLPTYAKVKYAGVYPGVDLVYYGNGRHLEYDFVVAPGADPNAVALHFAGADRLKIDAQGNLTITSRNGSIAFRKPVIYQINDGKRQIVDGSFQLMAGNNIRFRLGAYDHGRELVIDPTLEYSTYVGGTGDAFATGIAVDAAGNAYIAGVVSNYDFPPPSDVFPVTPDAFQKVLPASNSGGSAFVTKLNAAGTALVYSTYSGRQSRRRLCERNSRGRGWECFRDRTCTFGGFSGNP